MDTELLFQEIRQKYEAGVHLVTINRLGNATVEESLARASGQMPFFTWPYAERDNETSSVTATGIRRSLDQVPTRAIAFQILSHLLHKSMAYGVEVLPLEDANRLAAHFVSLFDNDAQYYSNSAWNTNKYSNDSTTFVLGLSGWNPCTDATFDSGIIIADSNNIGIAWFEDED